ncbi:MAG: glycosyl transferase [Deltaproteobacteria bacterium]|nr:glycosyl transferase [Deltaproteobacteria bacterium]
MPEWILENPSRVNSAEVVVGIPSLNEADHIAFPTEQASLGLKQFFKGRKSVVINCDNASTDGTRDAFFSAPCETPRMYISTPPGVRGKGANLKNLFRAATDLGARAIIVVDADIKSITPKWIRHLGEPLLDDFGFVAPLYLRHKYDGALTNNMAYPFTRCLYGRRVRQPLGGEFGFSGELAKYFLQHETWDESVARFGIDVWMATLAMYSRQPISQAFLGRPKTHREAESSGHLGPLFREVVGTMFHLMEALGPFWRDVKWSRPTAIFGFGLGETELPPPVSVDVEGLFQEFQQGARKCTDVWREALAPATYGKLQEVLDLDLAQFELPVLLWAHALFDMAVGYRDRILPSSQLLDALWPLYSGRTLSFVRATEGMGLQQSEEYVEEQCLAFEEAKPYLLERWGL